MELRESHNAATSGAKMEPLPTPPPSASSACAHLTPPLRKSGGRREDAEKKVTNDNGKTAPRTKGSVTKKRPQPLAAPRSSTFRNAVVQENVAHPIDAADSSRKPSGVAKKRDALKCMAPNISANRVFGTTYGSKSQPRLI